MISDCLLRWHASTSFAPVHECSHLFVPFNNALPRTTTRKAASRLLFDLPSRPLCSDLDPVIHADESGHGRFHE